MVVVPMSAWPASSRITRGVGAGGAFKACGDPCAAGADRWAGTSRRAMQPGLHGSRYARLVAVGQWVLLAYRLPRDPSTPRIALWRTLRRLGAAQLLDGLVALPADSRTREQLEWAADGV